MFGYKAVLGIGMRNLASGEGIGNSIAQLPGAPAFEIEAPAFGDDGGVLRMAPDEARYATVELPAIDGGEPLGGPAWDDRAVPACVGAFWCSIPAARRPS